MNLSLNDFKITTLFACNFQLKYRYIVYKNMLNFVPTVYVVSQNSITFNRPMSPLIVGKNLSLTKVDVYETLCPQQMLVHKGGKIKNWGGECRDVTPTKLQS